MSIIDTSWILNRARSFIGMNVTGPVDFRDEDILTCLDQETLPTLSIYLPNIVQLEVDTEEDRINGKDGVFLLRTNGERLLGVNRLFDEVGIYRDNLASNMIDRQLVADRNSAAFIDITWDFKAPATLEVFPKALSFRYFTVEAKCVHPTHLRTIPPTAREILRELFLADLAIDVLGVRQYFQNLQSVFGELNLNLDRLQQQADKRTEIIEKLEQKQHKHAHARRIFIA